MSSPLVSLPRFYGFAALGVHSVNAAAGFMPRVARVEMDQPAVVPIGKVHRAIGAGFGVDNAKPAVVGGDHWRRVDGA